VLDPLKVAADVVVVPREYAEAWGDVPGTLIQRDVSSPKPDLGDLAARFARKAESDEIALQKLGDGCARRPLFKQGYS
jgi:hypothetical protein